MGGSTVGVSTDQSGLDSFEDMISGQECEYELCHAPRCSDVGGRLNGRWKHTRGALQKDLPPIVTEW